MVWNIPSCTNSDQIDLLIGSGVPKAFHQYEQRKGADGQIYAVRLTLGWDLVGPKAVGKSGQFCGVLTEPNVFLIDHSPNNTDTIPFYLEGVFGHDYKDCSLFSSKVGPSIEDNHALDLAKSSILCWYSMETKPYQSTFKQRSRFKAFEWPRKEISERSKAFHCLFK